ncbi:MAG: hypothetical protein M3355_09665 [Actinomycetota bacterium]|nr:hypothetical protein [Actinomycetota bacterium]
MSVVAAWFLLRTETEPDSKPPPALAFVTDLPIPASQRERLAQSINVEVRAQPSLIGDCNPVRVRVDVQTIGLVPASPPFRVPARSRFALTIVGPGTIRSPTLYSHPIGQPDARLAGEVTERKITFPGGQGAGGTAVTLKGTVGTWPREPFPPPIPIEFQADWGERRSGGSCFVRLPELVGSQEVRAVAQEANELLGPRVRRTLGNASALGASARVTAPGGAVSRRAEETVPLPSDIASATWECRVDRGRSYVRLGGIGDYDPVKIVARGGRDCGAVTVITSQTVEDLRLFFLFVLAALISLGLQLLYESLFPRR